MTILGGGSIVCMLVLGLLLSAFFSGSETGFYRVSRLRLALDGRSGDTIAKTLLWLANRPPLFVATALLGNNLANYMTSLAILLATRKILGEHVFAEILMPVLLAPLVFVYGELLPKKLYFVAPNKLLRRGAPLFWFCFLIFAPFSLLLSGFGRLLQFVLGESPEEVRWRLARSEINKLLDEGKEIGILRPAQRDLAQAVSSMANHSVLRHSQAVHRFPTVSSTDSIETILNSARKVGATQLLVVEGSSKTTQGYVQISQLLQTNATWQTTIQPLATLQQNVSPLDAMIEMQSGNHALAEIVDASGRSLGVVSLATMARQLMS